MKTCCITGHRNILISKTVYIENKLREEVQRAIDRGYTNFISGFASGVDLVFAEIIVGHKEKNQITLEAAIPYAGRLKTPDNLFQSLIKYCDVIKCHSDTYIKSCYMKRNRYMVDKSDYVIAVYDGRKSRGTYATICYAKQQAKKINIIEI